MIKTNEIRQKFIDYFKRSGHELIEGSSLIPESDPSVLLTTAGMQQFKPYFMNPKMAPAKRVVSQQPCFRTSDIDEVGDASHLTLFEMLGNFSFSDYFKKEAIELAIQFLIQELKVPFEELHFTVFAGDQEIPYDQESYQLLQNAGVPAERIKKAGKEDNFWGPTGDAGPCGPTVEIYLGGVEVWNLVFNEYFKTKSSEYNLLKEKGVDTGLGLERLAAYLQKKKSIFELDEFLPLMVKIQQMAKEPNLKYERILADHLRGAVFLTAEGIVPSNLDRGYILRRLIRRSVRFGKLLKIEGEFLKGLGKIVQQILGPIYPKIKSEKTLEIIEAEERKFNQTIMQGIRLFEKGKAHFSHEIPAEFAFQLYDCFGFPFELTKELADEAKLKIDQTKFNQLLDQQKQRSREAEIVRRKQFANSGSEIAKNHTAAHLLHEALREVLGKHVEQKGQDLNPERLRFDFSHPQPMTPAEIEKVEELVNEQIQKSLPVKMKLTTVEEAKKSGARALFMSKYGDKVKLYSIGDYSKELCAGPHIKNTAELGHFKIIKEQSSSAGIRRIKAILE